MVLFFIIIIFHTLFIHLHNKGSLFVFCFLVLLLREDLNIIGVNKSKLVSHWNAVCGSSGGRIEWNTSFALKNLV